MKTTFFLLSVILALGPATANAEPVTHVARARAFVEAVNAADMAACESFHAEHRTTPLDDSKREAYLRIVDAVGRLAIEDIEDSGGTVVLGCMSSKTGEPVRLTFGFEEGAPGRIETVQVEFGRETDDGPPPVAGPSISPEDPTKAIAGELDRWLQARAAADEFSGAVVLTRDGSTVYEGAFGMADRIHQIPNTPATLFRVGSITKSFVQVAAARLVQDGRLDPSSTIAELLPEYPRLDIAGEITVDQLLAHRSGLGGMNYRGYLDTHAPDIRRPMDYIKLFADAPLLFEPGTAMEYSNAGYITLGAVLESVTGQRWEQVIEELVFVPAGMRSSCFIDLDRPQVAYATGYWHCDPSTPDLWCVNTPRLELVATASGGSYSTAMDLVRFARALRSDHLLEPGYTRWYFTGEWPAADSDAEPYEMPADGIAGGAEGVSAVLFVAGPWTLSVAGNLGDDAGERTGVAIADALGMLQTFRRETE